MNQTKVFRRRSTRRKMVRGFTLIELLVVIAVIAVLAAILFPVFSRVRENARRSSCQSNLKQIGLGLMQYIQDFDETMPFVNNDDGVRWMDAVYPYVNSEQVFNCPNGAKEPNGNSATKFKVNNTSGRGMYSMNVGTWVTPSTAHLGPASRRKDDVGAGIGANSTLVVVKAVQLVEPATTMWVGDGQGAPDVGYYDNWISAGAWKIETTGASTNIGCRYLGRTDQGTHALWPARHLDTISVLWCDGHVKSTKLETLATIRSGVMPALTIAAD